MSLFQPANLAHKHAPNTPVDMANKQERCTVADHPKHQEKRIADHKHVAKEEGCLHECRHV